MFRRLVLSLIVVVTLLLSIGGARYVNAQAPQANRPEYVPGEVLVKFKAGASANDIARIESKYSTQLIRHFASIGVDHLKLPEGMTVERALEALRAEQLVEYAAPNGLYYIDVTLPNDPAFGNLWGLNNTGQTGGTPDADIDAPEAWDITTGSSDVVIAVIDSGIDLNHEDLAANLWTNPNEIPGNSIDDDGNGYVDDVHGWDFVQNDNDPTDTSAACGGHGTHVSGTIGAVGNNGVGVTGVNWDVTIMPLRAFRTVSVIFCSASDADLIEAIEYYTMMNVRVSSNSWGGGSANPAMRDAIRATNSVFVAAAGNGGADGIGDNNDTTPNYPSNYPLDNIIAVAATDHNDVRASFSNYGTNSVDLGAPGEDIYSTLLNDSYGTYSGTSMATPHVSGAVGLLLAQDSTLTNNEIKWRILNGTDVIGLPVASGGRLNANGSLQFGLSVPDVTVDVTALGPTDVPQGGNVPYKVSVTNNTGSTVQVRVLTYAHFKADGTDRVLLRPTVVSVGAGQTLSRSFTPSLPASIPPGTVFGIFGQAETATSFDEDMVEYTIVP